MYDTPASWLIYLLVWIPNVRCLVADDDLAPVDRRKHGFQWQRSIFHEKFVRF